MRFIILTIVLFLFAPFTRANQIMGGEITWTCQANQYVFTLTLYRDCNQANVNNVIDLRLWNHPSIHVIPADFVQRIDLSPQCTEVAGSPNQLSCGSGNNGGNGIGAIEKIIYQTQPIQITGTPPSQGWAITYSASSRNPNITNISNPTTTGITIAATIYQSKNGNCVFNSPQFLESPYLILCKGNPYVYNMNCFSTDADSLSIELSEAKGKINISYNLPNDPATVNYANGYTFDSPTPDNSFNNQNQALTINPQTGDIQFLSYTEGSFVIHTSITAYKNGSKLSTIQREIQVTVVDCNSNNNPPIITSTLPTNQIIDVIAGDIINVDFQIKDLDLLQNGNPQTIELTGSGHKFGANFSSTSSGCGEVPCATLNESLPIYFSGTKNLHFNWETSCNHLLSGNTLQSVKSYTFVLHAKDDFCQIPASNYLTFQVNVHNQQNNLPEIDCIEPQLDGTYIVYFKNTINIPLPFYIQDENDNTVATINSNTTSSATIPAGNYESFHLSYSEPCISVGTFVSSAAKNIIHLTLQNPQNGTAFLQWTHPENDLTNYGSHYYIYQKPTNNNWILIDSVPNTINSYRDTITICKDFLQYQIEIKHNNCSMKSEIKGDTLQDLIAPSIPEIGSVSIDTTTNEVIINWSPSPEIDTYGYIIYETDELGILRELDTIYGNQNTVFSHITNTDDGSLTYSVAAFDSCFTQTQPPTFQTSAKSPLHTSIFLKAKFDACSQTASLDWSEYIGWQEVDHYLIFQKTEMGWIEVGTTTSTSSNIILNDFSDTTEFVIQGFSSNGQSAFSNKVTVNRLTSATPNHHYTKVATVENNQVVIMHYMEVLPFMTELVIQRKDNGQFEEIGRTPILGEENEFIDSTDINVNENAYTYRVLYVDSCGNVIHPANEVTTILSQINQVDENRMIIDIEWSPYQGFDGGVIQYEIYRAINGTYEWPAIYTANSNEFNFEDQLDESMVMDGKICYKVVAVEGQNKYGFHERSTSNRVCYTFEPLIYIPNAFTPNGMNPVFYPVINLANFQSYSMKIFDRWNDVIFTSNELSQGWNGIMNNGKKAPFGVYGYQISITDGNGNEIRKTGHVTIIWSNLE